MLLGLDYLLAFIKLGWNLAFAIVSALFFRLAWNAVVPIYLNFLPQVYWNIPYWKFVGIILVFDFVGEQIQKITPKIISISQNNTNKKEK